MSLFNELKRRNVFRVGIAYLIGAWLLAQIADLLIDNIGAPEWVMKTLFVVLALGFFMTLFFAWAFEMTPEGVKRESDVDRDQSITKKTGHKLDRTIIVILVLALSYFMWDKFSTDSSPPSATVVGEQQPLEKSIAVLPFVNMSADEDNEYFSDGLSEELLNLLAKVDGLKVAARTSTFKFKNSDADISEIGEKLNVATVLEGSVRKSGNQARITAQLIKVDDGFHLWSETYDRDLSNIFQVQDEIARAIVDALKLPLLGQDAKPLESRVAANFEAYDLYLLGLHHARTYNKAGFEQAVDYFTRAVAIDPTYAPAWGGLASNYLLSADYGDMPMSDAMALADKALEKAFALNPDLPEALNAKTMLLGYQGKLYESLLVAERAVKVDPNNVESLGLLSTRMSEVDPRRALALAQKAWELDPLSEDTRTGLVSRTRNTGDYKGAESMVRDMLMDEPDNPGLHEILAQIQRTQGFVDKAIPEYEMTWRLRPGDVWPAWQLAINYLVLDDLETAETWLQRARERGPDSRWTMSTELSVHYHQQEWESALNLLLQRQASEGAVNVYNNTSIGTLLVLLGRPTEAQQYLRKSLEMMGSDMQTINLEVEVEPGAQLINILEPGDERAKLLNALREFSSRFSAIQPHDDDAYIYLAYIATFDGDRDAVMESLNKAFELGRRNYRGLENNPIFLRWKDDLMFHDLILRMKQKAAEMRAQLEASQAVGTES